MICLPSYIDPEVWAAYLESRKAMKSPFTPLAQKLLIRKLMREHAEGYDVNEALEEAAIKGWKSIFPKKKISPNAKDPALEKIERDHQLAAPMPDDVKAKIAALTRRQPA